jgi:drug/metabolite transporter (DMT)-like permease
MASVELGVAAAFAASACYDVGIAAQALEARQAPPAQSLRPSLFASLVRRRTWIAGTALVAVGWPLEIFALSQAPLTLVAPALAIGLLLLLALGRRVLGERVGPRELLGMVAIVGGVAGIGMAAPDHTSAHSSTGSIAIGLAVLGAAALFPYLARTRNPGGIAVVAAAGAAYAWNEFASKLISDHLVRSEFAPAAALTALTAASAVVGLLSEMTALQHRPATQVAPLVYVVQVTVPVLLAPLLGGEDWGDTPLGGGVLVVLLLVVAAGAAVLAGSRLVAAATDAAAGHAAGAGEGTPASSRQLT